MNLFLVADTQLYKRLCPSVGPSVPWSFGPLVHWSIGLLVRRFVGPLVRWSVGPFVRQHEVLLAYV